MNINPQPADTTSPATAGAAAAAVANSTPSTAISINMADPSTMLASTIPNSKPREQSPKKLQTYVYQDLANAEPSQLNSNTCHERVPPQSLQSQKLPSKLAAMLSDPGEFYSLCCWLVSF